MVQLEQFIEQIRVVYAAIAKKIEELLTLLNEAELDENSRQLAARINAFLNNLRRSVGAAAKSSSSLPEPKRAQFLNTIRQELQEIKQLEAFIALAKKRPTPEVIRRIHELYQEVSATIEKERRIVGKGI